MTPSALLASNRPSVYRRRQSPGSNEVVDAV
jgi:hypothetical protein